MSRRFKGRRWKEARLLHFNIAYEATDEEPKGAALLRARSLLSSREAENAYDEAMDILVNPLDKFSKAFLYMRVLTRHLSKRRNRFRRRCRVLTFLSFPMNFSNEKVFAIRSGLLLVRINDTITNTLKFHYLKSCVSDTTAKLINNLSMSDDNYSSAWKTLTDEDKRSLIHLHLESFVCFPAMKSENLVELKKLRDTDTAHAMLANLGSPIEHWDHIIVFIISMKFSPKTRMEKFRKIQKICVV